MDDLHLDTFLQLETSVWQALATGDARADENLLSDDFLGVYPSGFSDRAGHVAQLANGPTVASFELIDPRLLVVSDDAVMLAYKAKYTRPSIEGAAPTETMFISSLWCHRDGRWVNVFSQDTVPPTDADQPD